MKTSCAASPIAFAGTLLRLTATPLSLAALLAAILPATAQNPPAAPAQAAPAPVIPTPAIQPAPTPAPTAPGVVAPGVVAPGMAERQDRLRRVLVDMGGTNALAASTSTNVVGSTTPLLAPPLRPGSIAIPSDATAANPRGRSVTNAPSAEEPMVAIPPPPGGASGDDQTVAAGEINFPATDLNQVLQIYAELVNRTVLRPTTLPAPTITLRTQTPLTKREAVQALDAVLSLNGITMINVGDKFVKAVPVTQANQEGARFNRMTADQLPELGQYVTHVVQLQYIRPSEIIQALQPFAKMQNSILPIDSSQILVLRDNTENVKRMLEMIKEIDVPVPSEFISEVIPIKYALASEIASALNSLSSGGGGASIGSSGTGGTTGTTGARTSFGANRSGGSFGRSMMGGGYGGQYGNNPMNPMGAQSGLQTGAQGGSFTDRLRNLVQRASASGDIVVLGQTKIIADERTNSLLIFASREDMRMIKDVVAKLDVVLAQVLIEAVILEVGLKSGSELGVSYLQYPQTSGNLTAVGGGGAGNMFSPGDFISGGGTNAAGALTGGFNYLFRWGDDLDVAVSAMANNSRAKVLQRPRIQTSHAVQAQLFVGESRPYPTASQYGGVYGSYSSIQQLQIGVTLDVTPLINPDGLVVMDIHQTIENYAGFTEITGVGRVPNTTRKEAAAKVAVRDRDTIILGGLITTDHSREGSGIPILMDIPVLGALFRKSSANENRTELIVLIRPTVLPTPEIAALTATAEKDRMPGVRRAEAEFEREEARRLREADRFERRNRSKAEPRPQFEDYPLENLE